jgi:hypothetical protein
VVWWTFGGGIPGFIEPSIAATVQRLGMGHDGFYFDFLSVALGLFGVCIPSSVEKDMESQNPHWLLLSFYKFPASSSTATQFLSLLPLAGSGFSYATLWEGPLQYTSWVTSSNKPWSAHFLVSMLFYGRNGILVGVSSILFSAFPFRSWDRMPGFLWTSVLECCSCSLFWSIVELA